MRIFNQTKTIELNSDELDLTLGHLVAEKLFIQHHEEAEAVPAKSAEEIAAEMQSSGKQVEVIGGKFYEVKKVYNNGGRHVEEIKAQPAIPAVEAWDEYEDIQVYAPYTEEELLEIKKQELREWREKYFTIIDRAVWYDCLTEEQKAEVREFRQKLLDITLTLEKPVVPECVEKQI